MRYGKKYTMKEEKGMFRRELMKVGLIVTISLLSLTGCSCEGKQKPNETTSVETGTDEEKTGKESQETTTGEEVIGKFDPADVCKNISINGELVEFPWTLNKLGDEYEFDDVLRGNPDDQISGAYLLYKGEEFLLINIGDEIGDRDSQIVVMSFSVSDNISVYNLGKGATTEDVVKMLGEPNAIRDKGLSDYDFDYVYVTDEMLLELTFYKGKLIETYINVYGDWK